MVWFSKLRPHTGSLKRRRWICQSPLHTQFTATNRAMDIARISNIFEHLRGTDCHYRVWNLIVNMADKSPTLTDLARGRENNQKEKERECFQVELKAIKKIRQDNGAEVRRMRGSSKEIIFELKKEGDVTGIQRSR